jgi:amino acid transporter
MAISAVEYRVGVGPALDTYTLLLCLGVLALLTLVNLRGISDAGRLFALPPYLFVGSFVVILLLGLYAVVLSGGYPRPIVAPPKPPQAAEAADLWLLLPTFASGCAAMTGVEAVSNGVTTFREPRVKLARRTLAIIVLTIAILLTGIAYLATAYGVAAPPAATTPILWSGLHLRFRSASATTAASIMERPSNSAPPRGRFARPARCSILSNSISFAP